MKTLRTSLLLTAMLTAQIPGVMAQTCSGAANSNLINLLGTAGPNNFAVLSLGGAGALVNINLGTVSGPFANVGVPNTGTFKESAPSSVAGNIIVGSLVNTSGAKGAHGPIIVNDSLLAQAVHDANYAASMFAMLPPTAAVQAQFPADGQVTGSLTVTGTAGLNVVNLPSFLLNNGSNTLTLTGPSGTAFVINVAGNFNLHSGNISVSGGVGPLDVVYNITDPSAKVTTMVPTTASGILLAPNNNINTMDSSSFTGEVIGGFQKSIVLMSGTVVTNPCSGSSSATFCLTLQKQFFDGISTSPDLLGWGMNVTGPSGVTTHYVTDSTSGQVSLCQLPVGTYTVAEDPTGPTPPFCGASPYQTFLNGVTQPTPGTATFTVTGTDPVTVLFVNRLGCAG